MTITNVGSRRRHGGSPKRLLIALASIWAVACDQSCAPHTAFIVLDSSSFASYAPACIEFPPTIATDVRNLHLVRPVSSARHVVRARRVAKSVTKSAFCNHCVTRLRSRRSMIRVDRRHDARSG